MTRSLSWSQAGCPSMQWELQQSPRKKPSRSARKKLRSIPGLNGSFSASMKAKLNSTRIHMPSYRQRSPTYSKTRKQAKTSNLTICTSSRQCSSNTVSSLDWCTRLRTHSSHSSSASFFTSCAYPTSTSWVSSDKYSSALCQLSISAQKTRQKIWGSFSWSCSSNCSTGARKMFGRGSAKGMEGSPAS